MWGSSKAIGINKYNDEIYGELGYIYNKLKLIQTSKKYSNYKNYLPALEFANNILKKLHTNFAPNQLRIYQPIYTSFLEMNLRLKAMANIKPKDYMINNVIDYNKFHKIMKNSHKLLLNKATKRRIQFAKERQLIYNDIKTTPFIANEYIIYKPSNTITNKLLPNEYYGWYIKKILVPGKKYIIKNIFNNEEKNINHGHIKHFHGPLWGDPKKALQGS